MILLLSGFGFSHNGSAIQRMQLVHAYTSRESKVEIDMILWSGIDIARNDQPKSCTQPKPTGSIRLAGVFESDSN